MNQISLQFMHVFLLFALSFLSTPGTFPLILLLQAPTQYDKRNMDDVEIFKTTYKDNPYLPSAMVKEIEGLYF